MLWDLFQDMRELQSEIDRLIDLPLNLPRLYYAENKFKYPPLNLREDNNNLYLDVSLPGVDKDNIRINIKNQILSISGQKSSPAKVEPKNYHRRERIIGNFIRAVELPMEVEVNKVSADYENGILSITLPKTEGAKPKIIEVKVK